jgi:hypothetical protein
MAIRTIREVPSQLPHAHLYLDDIVEISSILQDAAFESAKLERDRIESEVLPSFKASSEESLKVKDLLGSQRSITPANISYSVGDTKMDSITDLQSFGGSSAKFEMGLENWGPRLRFTYFMNPELQLHSLDEAQQWVTYGRIKSIFDRRQLRIKNAIESLPGWLKCSLWIFLALTPELFPHTRHGAYFAIGYISTVALIGYVYFLRPSRVFFLRSHERTRASSEARRRTVREISILVVGGVIGGLIIELVHRFWFK